MRILALALAFLLSPQDEKFTFKFSPKQGEKVTRTKKIEFKLDIEVESQGQSFEVEQRETEKRIVEYAGVEDGTVTKRVVEFVEAFQESKQPPTMEWTRTDKALHGRKVTVTMKDGKPVWIPHEFDHDSGVGTQFEVADVNGDGLLDVVTSNKKGVNYFQQVRE